MGIFSKNGIIKSDGAARSIRQSGLEEREALANIKVPKKEPEPNQGTTNDSPDGKRFFTSQALQTAYVRLKTRLSDVDTKFDPEMYVAGVTIALAYIQKESRIFSDFTVFMLASFGEPIKPHLLSFYTAISNAPDIVASGLTSYEECLKEHALMMRLNG